MLGKRRGLFGSPGTTAFAEMTQGVGALRPMTNQPVDVMQAPPVEKKPGVFGNGGVGWQIMGSIGDALREANGLEASYGPSMMQQRQMQFLQQRAEQQRKYELEDYVSKLKLKQQYDPSPGPQPHYWETNDGSLAMIGPDGQPKVLYKDPTPKTEYQTVRNPDGTITVYPMPQIGGAATGPKVIGSQLPPGWTVEGGSGGNVGGGFRPGY